MKDMRKLKEKLANFFKKIFRISPRVQALEDNGTPNPAKDPPGNKTP